MFKTVLHRLLKSIAFAAVAITAILSAPVITATAQDRLVEQTAEEKAKREARLREVNRTLREARERQEKFDAEMAELGKDIGSINRVLLKTTSRAQELEGAVAATETRLEALKAREESLLIPLARKRGVMMEVLAALQRVGKNPPPALLVSPNDALASVHSSLLLGAVVPQLRDQAASLRLELQALAKTRDQIDAEGQTLASQLNNLAEDEARLTRLLTEKETLIEESKEQIAKDIAAAEKLKSEAETLTDLIAGLDSELKSAAKIAEAARLADEKKRAEEEARLAKAKIALAERAPNGLAGMLSSTLDPTRQKPAIPFGQTRGLLPRPVQGVELYEFGTPLPTGPRKALRPAPNIAITTRANARVRAPADGWVVYAGPFRSYGSILILNAGDGYNIVLSGLSQTDLVPGRFVLAGEPVGRMGPRRMARASVIGQGVASLGGDRPVLYVEFRKDGKPINPDPWWSGEENLNVAAIEADPV